MAQDAKKEKAEKETRALTPTRTVERLPSVDRDIESVSRLFDRMFDEFWRRPFPSLWAPERWRAPSRISLEVPAIDFYEEEEEFVIKADVPGMDKEDIEINLSGETLTIKGDKKKEEEVKEEGYWCRERSYGSFARSIEVPAGVKSDQVKATFKDGVLEIRLPKAEEAKKKTVTVKID